MLKGSKLPSPIDQLITIDPQLGARSQVADYLDLKPLAEGMNIPVHQVRSYSLKNEEDLDQIRSMEIDIAFVIGWQRLLPAEVLNTIRLGAFGMHGSSMDLPLGRGRSPMNWALIEGRKVFYTNLFRYDPGVDSGDVVDTLKFEIGQRDTAESLHFKNMLAMKCLIERNIDPLLSGEISLTPQDDSIRPTYYPKRTPDDGLIDFDLDVHSLDRFIRAVTRPFDGAFTLHDGKRITIYNAQVFDLNEFGYEKLKTGTVAMVFNDRKFLIKCIGGLLLVNDHRSEIPIREGMTLGSGDLAPRYFPRNKLGFHDMDQD